MDDLWDPQFMKLIGSWFTQLNVDQLKCQIAQFLEPKGNSRDCQVFVASEISCELQISSPLLSGSWRRVVMVTSYFLPLERPWQPNQIFSYFSIEILIDRTQFCGLVAMSHCKSWRTIREINRQMLTFSSFSNLRSRRWRMVRQREGN